MFSYWQKKEFFIVFVFVNFNFKKRRETFFNEVIIRKKIRLFILTSLIVLIIFTINTNIKSFSCMPETNIVFYVNFTSIKIYK